MSLLASLEYHRCSMGDVCQRPSLLHHLWETNRSCSFLETEELAVVITHVNLCDWNFSFLSFFQKVFSSFYWSLVFFKLSVQCQLFLFFLWLLLSTAYLHLCKKGHAKCIKPCSFHVASCKSHILWFEPIHPASAQAGFHWDSVYGSHSEHSAETQLINCPAVLLPGLFQVFSYNLGL